MTRSLWIVSGFVVVGLAGCARAVEDAESAAPAPEFSLPSVGGGTVALDDFSGKPVLLYFHMAVG